MSLGYLPCTYHGGSQMEREGGEVDRLSMETSSGFPRQEHLTEWMGWGYGLVGRGIREWERRAELGPDPKLRGSGSAWWLGLKAWGRATICTSHTPAVELALIAVTCGEQIASLHRCWIRTFTADVCDAILAPTSVPAHPPHSQSPQLVHPLDT